MNYQKKNKTITGKLAGFVLFVLMTLPLLFIAEAMKIVPLAFHSILLFTGWLSWTYTEYFFHRFIMHESDSSTGLGKLLNHSHHHKDPADIRITTAHRIIMTATSIGLIILSIFLNNYFTLFCGYFFGFTAFCLMHVLLHHSWSKKVFPQLHQFHIHHHCKHTDKCFGVTASWWDHLFGTVPDKNTMISGRILAFYYKRGKRSEKKIISLNNILDEKIQFPGKQPA